MSELGNVIWFGWRNKMNNQFFRGLIICMAIITLMTSCSKLNLPFIGSSSNISTRELNGVEYKVITPSEYAKQLKGGNIGTGEKFVIDGLCLGSSEESLMLQKAGLTNVFTLEEPIDDLKIGQKVRIYIEVSLVNTVLVNMSEAKVVKLEIL